MIGFAVHEFTEAGGGTFRGGGVLDEVSSIKIPVPELAAGPKTLDLAYETDTHQAQDDADGTVPHFPQDGRPLAPEGRQRAASAPPEGEAQGSQNDRILVKTAENLWRRQAHCGPPQKSSNGHG